MKLLTKTNRYYFLLSTVLFGLGCGLLYVALQAALARAPDVIEPGLRVLERELLVGVGGILSGADAQAKIAAGADVVQMYTGLIYKGPALVREVAQALRPRSA